MLAVSALGCGSDADAGSKQVENSLTALRRAEETYFDKHGRYTERLPDLQLIGPAGVSGMLAEPGLTHEIETGSHGRIVTVTIESSQEHGWFSLLNGREYGTGYGIEE